MFSVEFGAYFLPLNNVPSKCRESPNLSLYLELETQNCLPKIAILEPIVTCTFDPKSCPVGRAIVFDPKSFPIWLNAKFSIKNSTIFHFITCFTILAFRVQKCRKFDPNCLPTNQAVCLISEYQDKALSLPLVRRKPAADPRL